MTRTYLIAYDVSQSPTCQTRIADLMKTLGEAWARPLDTVWMLRTNLSAEALEARLAPVLGTEDGLMVQETRGEAAFANTSLRWFRPRRETALAALDTAAVLAFRELRADGVGELHKAA